MKDFTCEEGDRGLCECGCGNRTNVINKNDSRTSRVAGEYSRFLRGHNRRKTIRYVEVPTGYATPCWMWQLAKTRDGYGRCSDTTGKIVLAHRFYYEKAFGAIPDGLECDHLCRVRACVRPDHLDPVTRAENAQRGSRTKLNVEVVRGIRSSTDLQRVLARRYGVSQSQISRIRSGQSWRLGI